MINKNINLKGLVDMLLEVSLGEISYQNNGDNYIYFNEEKSEWLIKPEYEDLRFSLKKAFTSELEELGFKHKD